MQDSKFKKKMEQICLNGLAYVIIFQLAKHDGGIVILWARYGGGAVFHMPFWTTDISLNIELGLMNPIF